MYKINSKLDKPNIQYMKNRLTQMMERGIAIANLRELLNTFISEQEELKDELRKMCRNGSVFIENPNSSKQINEYLASLKSPEIYEACYVDGKWTSDKNALLKLSKLGFTFADNILAYRRAKKYAESIRSVLDSVGTDGKVHPVVSLAKTNRVNYSSPALMNIPKPLLWHLVQPLVEGDILVSADIKNQEPNILINLLGEEDLKPALSDTRGLYEYLFERVFKFKPRLNIWCLESSCGIPEGVISNEELNSMTALRPIYDSHIPPIYYKPDRPYVVDTYINGQRVRSIDVTNVVIYIGSKSVSLPDTVLIEDEHGGQYRTKVIWENIDFSKIKKPGILEYTGEVSLEIQCKGVARSEFKAAWNAISYGASSMGIGRICKHIDGSMVYKYFTKLPRFKKYREFCADKAKKNIKAINTYFGTTLTTDEFGTQRLKRVLMDLPIQGTAADILSLLIMHFDSEVKNRGLQGLLDIYYTRHDEMIFEVSSQWVQSVGLDTVKGIIRDIIEHQVDSWEPFKLEVNAVEPGRLYNDMSDDPFDED